MSIDMYITRCGRAPKGIPVCGQNTGVEYIGQLARQHRFRILTGVYPVWVVEGDLQQLLSELAIIRMESDRRLRLEGRDDENLAYLDQRWAKLIEALEPLADEKDWEVTFG